MRVVKTFFVLFFDHDLPTLREKTGRNCEPTIGLDDLVGRARRLFFCFLFLHVLLKIVNSELGCPLFLSSQFASSLFCSHWSGWDGKLATWHNLPSNVAHFISRIIFLRLRIQSEQTDPFLTDPLSIAVKTTKLWQCQPATEKMTGIIPSVVLVPQCMLSWQQVRLLPFFFVDHSSIQ